MKTENKRDLSGYQQRIEKAEKKLDSLLSMRADGEISKEEYHRAKLKCEQEIKELQAAMLGNGQEEDIVDESIDMQYVRDLLGKISLGESGKADKDVLMEFIDTITVEKGNMFRWGLWLRNKPSYFRMTTSGRGDNMTASAVGAEFDAKECSDAPNTGQNVHFTPAGCDHHRRTSRTLANNQVRAGRYRKNRSAAERFVSPPFLFSCGTIQIVLSEKSKKYIVFDGNSLQKKLINFLHNVTEMC